MDLSAVKRTPQPTRDVLVTRSLDGDRTFSGFGKAKANEYADCFIDSATLPTDVLKVWPSILQHGYLQCWICIAY